MRTWILAGILVALAGGVGAYKVTHKSPCDQLAALCREARETSDLGTTTKCSFISLAAPKAKRTDALCADLVEQLTR